MVRARRRVSGRPRAAVASAAHASAASSVRTGSRDAISRPPARIDTPPDSRITTVQAAAKTVAAASAIPARCRIVAPSRRMRLSVIIPVYNEEQTIHEVLERVAAVDLGGIEMEIVVANDGSTDGTRRAIDD